MFICEHANTWDAKQILRILFFNNPNNFFCDSLSLFIKMYIPLLEYRIYLNKRPASNKCPPRPPSTQTQISAHNQIHPLLPPTQQK